MKRYRIRLSRRAEKQLSDIRSWWARHRREHPDLVDEDLDEAMRMLAAFPHAGVAHPSRAVQGARKALLPRSQYHVFYLVDEELEEVRVIAVWRASRGKGPTLR